MLGDEPRIRETDRQKDAEIGVEQERRAPLNHPQNACA
jgi:hypothetical protein